MEITNTSRALRGVNTEDQGTVWLQPGQTLDLRVSEAEKASLDKVAKDYGLFYGTREAAVEALKEEQGEDGDLGSLADGGTNYDDPTTTDIPQVAATLHPLPADEPLDAVEQPMDATVITTPWDGQGTAPSSDTGEDAGTGATTGGDDGAAPRRAKARG